MFEDDTIDQFGGNLMQTFDFWSCWVFSLISALSITDNVHSFKAAADAAWIYIAKTEGLKQYAEQVSLLCASLLRQEFPDQEFDDVPVTKKRGRASVDKTPASPVEKSPPRKRTVRKEEAAHSTAKGKKAAVEDIEEEEVEVTITSADKVRRHWWIAFVCKLSWHTCLFVAVDCTEGNSYKTEQRPGCWVFPVPCGRRVS